MAWRVRVARLETGGVLEPATWLANQNALAGEFNGMLDRDNIPANAIDEGRIVNNACHDQFGSTVPVAWSANPGLTGWQHDDGAGNLLPEVERFWAFDSLLIVDASIAYRWTAVAPTDIQQDLTVVQGRIVVDGTVLDDSGSLSLAHRQGAIHLCGALPVAAGDHSVRFEVRNFRVSAVDDSIMSLVDTLITYIPRLTISDGELVVVQKKR